MVDVCLEIWTREFSWSHVGLVAILIEKVIMHTVASSTIKRNFLKTLKQKLHEVLKQRIVTNKELARFINNSGGWANFLDYVE